MTLETAFSLLPGRLDEDRVRTTMSSLIDLGWIRPERHGDLVQQEATPSRNAVETITRYWQAHGSVVIEGGGSQLSLTSDSAEERMTGHVLACWTPDVPNDHADGMARIAKILQSPISVASLDRHVRLERLLQRGRAQQLAVRLRGYSEGLIGLYWRNVLGPPFTALFGDRLHRVPARDLGDGFWFIELGPRPEDETTDAGRQRESEIIDVLGRDAFYDLANEKKPTRVPDVGVASVNRYVIAYRSSPGFSLATARELLVYHAFDVTGTGDEFTARWRGGPEVHVRSGDAAAAKAEIEKRAHLEDDERAKLASCDAAIEVTFDDDPNLSAVNTSRLSERVLRDATGGLVFQRWDDSVYDGRLDKISRYRFTVLANGFSIEQARDALAESDFRIGPIPGGYSAQWHGGPVLYLRTVDAAAARKEIEDRIGEQPELAACDVAIDVAFDDLDEVQDEANTLIESQMQLASASNGFLFLHWNDTLQSPD